MKIPFDLDKALKGAKVVTRANEPVQELYHFKTARHEQALKAVIHGSIASFWSNGCFDLKQAHSEYDLFLEVPEPITYYVDLFYHVHSGYNLGEPYDNKNECLENRGYKEGGLNNFVKTIEFTVGDESAC